MARIHVPAVMGFYDDASDLIEVTTKARIREGFEKMDAYTPYPVHGIEEALGLKPSMVGTIARAGLFGGLFLGFMFQSWTSSVAWPINIGGKPFISWPAWIPITFEMGVLMAGIANLLGLFFLCGLYPKANTIVLSRRITDDRFVLVIPVKDEEEEKRAVAFLERHMALKIKIIDGIDKEKGQVIFRHLKDSDGEAAA
jgi:Alternative complex III, ActD subunit